MFTVPGPRTRGCRAITFPILGPLPIPPAEDVNAALRRLSDPWALCNASDARDERRIERRDGRPRRRRVAKWEQDLVAMLNWQAAQRIRSARLQAGA